MTEGDHPEEQETAASAFHSARSAHYVFLSACACDYQNERWPVTARIDDPGGIMPDFRNVMEP